MTHSHQKACEHKLKHCAECDHVYCEKCDKEWEKVGSRITSISPGTQINPMPWNPNGIGGIGGLANGIMLCVEKQNHDPRKNFSTNGEKEFFNLSDLT